MKTLHRRQGGAGLIEILVTVLILSFGMLSLSGMLAYAVQLPKMSAYRATAVMLASAHVERMRANIPGFVAGAYKVSNTYPPASAPSGTPCSHPNCDEGTLATADNLATRQALYRELPVGDMMVQCTNNDCSLKEGDIWVMWLEPSSLGNLNAASDECPPGASFTEQPRCIHIKFKL